MSNIEKLISYTKDKKNHQITKFKNDNLDDSLRVLSDYLDDIEKRSKVSRRLEYLSDWYTWQFLSNYLLDKELSYNTIALGTLYRSECNIWRFNTGLIVTTYNKSLRVDVGLKNLAEMLYLGWNDMAVSYGHLLLEMLYGKQNKGGFDHPLHPWFITELFCKWRNIELDKNRLSYPQSLSVYEAALIHWDSKDMQKVSDIVDILSDFHINQSDENVITDEDGNEFSPEFTSSDYFIFPVEILMWLAIRRNLGLPEYIPSAKNELMQLEINKLPKVEIPVPKVELIDKCKAKLRQDNPSIKFRL